MEDFLYEIYSVIEEATPSLAYPGFLSSPLGI